MSSSKRRFRSWIAGNRAATVVLVSYALLSSAYNLADPLFEPPDELPHFEFIQFLQRQVRLPVVDLAGPETEYHQPPLYYAIAALITAPLPKGDVAGHTLGNPFWGYEIGSVGHDNKNQYLHGPRQQFPYDETGRAVHSLRFLSTLIGCGTVMLTYLLARRFVSKSLAVASMAIVAFIPNFLLTSGAVTNDPLVILFAAAVGLILVDLVGRTAPPAKRVWAGLGALLGLAMLTKLSAWPLIPVAGVTVALLAWRFRSWRTLVVGGTLVATGAALVAGWWIIRNWMLYGDLTGLTSMWAVWGMRRPPTWHAYWRELHYFRTTFWASFGYGNIPVPGWIYRLLDVLVVVGVTGLLVALVRCFLARRRDPVRRDQILVLLAWTALTFVSLVWYFQRTVAVTGRQVYPILPVIGLGIAAGWGSLTRHSKAQTWPAALLGGAMAALAIGTLAGVLIPAYRPAPSLAADQAEEAIEHRLDWQVGDVALLLGYSLSPSAVRAGGNVAVTLYWQALKTPERNYTVFVHLFGEENMPAGQRDTYPGLGNSPTVYWTRGKIIEDTIGVPVAADAEGPLLLDIEAGLHDLETDRRLSMVDSAGNTVGRPIIGTVKLMGEPGERTAPSYASDATFESGLRLEGYDLSTTTPAAGSVLSVTLHWSPGGPLVRDYTTFIHLVDAADQIAAQGDGPPFQGRYPTSAWAEGELLDDTCTVALPRDLAAGEYHLVVGLYDPTKAGERLALAGGGDSVRLETTILVH